MASIPGWAYLLIGLVISGFSKFTEIKSGQNMTFFFWAGIFFLIIGTFKLVAFYILGKFEAAPNHKRPEPAHALSRPLQRHNTNQHTQTQQQGPRQFQNQASFTHPNTQAHVAQARATPHQAHVVAHHNAHNANPYAAYQQSHAGHQAIGTITCPSCRTRHYAYANFCMVCGHNLKRR